MAESDSGEKTEEPTAKKLSDARKKGQIARSKDLGTMFVLVGSALAMMLMGNALVSALATTMKRMFSISRKEAMDVHAMSNIIFSGIGHVVFPMLAIFAIIIIAAFIGNTIFGGHGVFLGSYGTKSKPVIAVCRF
ncbi:EscU/YscU/HrcU family type III secretion system export apparatus switch protein [Colwellia sp. MSW7]|uniref:Flagellar biosynthetic protein FlhB n=1 Tax=Colwellia maritima TaxID=2912588 RepID=A0ABS9X2Y2_9GAMM|nr:EscU/YscU/HrcU family type III secretion system export apparatus switch protein [Colwellia maritima]MCI2284602.1 EscU/YscU/HrcU family type III secretion system export apparatus switch protein [Colwellia maritima]